MADRLISSFPNISPTDGDRLLATDDSGNVTSNITVSSLATRILQGIPTLSGNNVFTGTTSLNRLSSVNVPPGNIDTILATTTGGTVSNVRISELSTSILQDVPTLPGNNIFTGTTSLNRIDSVNVPAENIDRVLVTTTGGVVSDVRISEFETNILQGVPSLTGNNRFRGANTFDNITSVNISPTDGDRILAIDDSGGALSNITVSSLATRILQGIPTLPANNVWGGQNTFNQNTAFADNISARNASLSGGLTLFGNGRFGGLTTATLDVVGGLTVLESEEVIDGDMFQRSPISIPDGITIGPSGSIGFGTGTANRLSTYATGSWTPVFSNGAGTITPSRNTFTRIGNVTILNVDLTNVSSRLLFGVHILTITGLPVVANSGGTFSISQLYPGETTRIRPTLDQLLSFSSATPLVNGSFQRTIIYTTA